jgi:di/tricarboxylate transporter
MQLTQGLLVVIVVVPLGLVMANRLRMDIAALLMAVALGILQFAGLGLLGPAQTPADAVKAISGFSQPVIITLIALFIMTRGLESSGVTRWMARQIMRLGGSRPSSLIVLFAALTAFLSLFMNNLAAGALVLPSAMETARRMKVRPSKLLIPVAYGSLLGGSATYFTTANILMSDLLRIAKPPQAPLHILDFTPTGGLIALAGILFLWLFGDRLLPDREPLVEQAVARRTTGELEELYQIDERLWAARVLADSPFAGKTLAECGIGRQWGVSVALIQHNPHRYLPPDLDRRIYADDILMLIGREEKIAHLRPLGLDIQPAGPGDPLAKAGIAFYEVILAPHSREEGKTLKSISFRQASGLTAVALKRLARSYRTDVGEIPLAFGDSLLVTGSPERIRALRRNPDFIVIEPDPGDQPIRARQALLTALVTVAAVAASILGVPVYLSMLAGALVTLLLRLLTVEEAYQSVEWQAVFLIAGMYAVSLAMVQTGLADRLGGSMVALVSRFGALGIAAGAYLLTAVLTQFMGGQVSALVTGPVVISAALSIGADPHAVAVATAIGCSASFLTPMAHPVNVLMIAPANYRFSDFFRAGWPLTLLSFLMLIVGLLVFWRL